MERGLRKGPGIPLLEETWKADSLALICNTNGLYCTHRALQPCEATCRDKAVLPRSTLLPLKVLISVRGPRLSRRFPYLAWLLLFYLFPPTREGEAHVPQFCVFKHFQFLGEPFCIPFLFWLPSFCLVSLSTDHEVQGHRFSSTGQQALSTQPGNRHFGGPTILLNHAGMALEHSLKLSSEKLLSTLGPHPVPQRLDFWTQRPPL